MKLSWPNQWGLGALGLAVLVVLLVAVWTTYGPFGLVTDIDAQRSMAIAAWAMFGLAALSFPVGVVTLYLLWRTFQKTAETANTARDQLAVTRKTVAPRLVLASAVATLRHDPDMMVDISFELHNFGQTAAAKIQLASTGRIRLQSLASNTETSVTLPNFTLGSDAIAAAGVGTIGLRLLIPYRTHQLVQLRDSLEIYDGNVDLLWVDAFDIKHSRRYAVFERLIRPQAQDEPPTQTHLRMLPVDENGDFQ